MESESPVYVVEHLDEELYPWCILEYKSIISLATPKPVWFTNSSFSKPQEWDGSSNFKIIKESIAHLNIPIDSICLLDSESPVTLSSEDFPKFKYFLFGGILGNTDEFDFDRTSVLRSIGFATRNLGNLQMTTDTAVRTAKKIIEEKMPFDSLNFVDRPEISSSVNEQLILNFRFLADDSGKPLIAPGICDLLIKDNDFDLNKLE